MRLLLLVTILAANGFVAKAQYKQHQPFRDYYTARAIGGERVYQRLYVGAGKHFINGKADLAYSGPDTLGVMFDTSFTQRIRARGSYTFHVGTFFPFVLLSDNTALAFNAEFLYSFTYLAIDSVFFHPKALYKKAEPITMIGVPLSLEFKSGGDVSQSSVQRSMFAIGGGGLLGGTSTYLDVKKQFPVAFIPFIKVEAGFFAGIAVKLRGVAYLGSAGFMDRTEGNIFGTDKLITKSHSGYGYQLSVIIMPFSNGWRSEEWY